MLLSHPQWVTKEVSERTKFYKHIHTGKTSTTTVAKSFHRCKEPRGCIYNVGPWKKMSLKFTKKCRVEWRPSNVFEGFLLLFFSFLVFFFSSCILDLGGWYNSNWWYIPIVTNLLKNQRFVTARIPNFMNDFEKSKTKVHQWKSKSGLDLLKKVSHLTKDCLRKCHRKLCKHDISFSENE